MVIDQKTGTRKTLQDRLTVPLLFLSSEDVSWDGLLVRAYHEPMELESWSPPSTSEITLVVLTSGAMLFGQKQVNGCWQDVPLHRHDLVLNPGDTMIREMRWRSLSAEPPQTLQIHLSSYLFAHTAQEVTGRDPAHLTLFGRSGFQDPLLTHIGLALQREVEQPSATSKLYAQTAAQMLVVHLLRHYTTPAQQIKAVVQGLTWYQMSQVKDFVLTHLDQDLTLTTLAKLVGFSPYHFARQFRQATGESPHQFVLSQRIQRAKQLLSETDLPLAQVALTSGFANQSHLTQAFKHSLGITPATYRGEHRIRAHF